MSNNKKQLKMVNLKNVKVEKREVKGSHTQIEINNHDPGKRTIARVYNSREDRFDAEELAQLFAAAPEMYRAAQIMLSEIALADFSKMDKKDVDNLTMATQTLRYSIKLAKQ